MAQWAILVGLNQYQFFQPLSCAQQDADAAHQLLLTRFGFSPERCILMTENSPQVMGRSTLPARANLQAWIDTLAQQDWQPGDSLWFFFSGYGVCQYGNDYLVPLDGSSSAIETTCLAVRDLFNCFRAALPLGDIYAILDMSRSLGSVSSYATVGIQTAQLANQLGITTILSCQPGQFSREVSSLGQGLFTHAFLEALHYHPDICPTVLMQFLGDRLTELSEHYWLPSQKPVLVAQADKAYRPLWHQPASQSTNGSPPPVTTESAMQALQQSGFFSPGTSDGSGVPGFTKARVTSNHESSGLFHDGNNSSPARGTAVRLDASNGVAVTPRSAVALATPPASHAGVRASHDVLDQSAMAASAMATASTAHLSHNGSNRGTAPQALEESVSLEAAESNVTSDATAEAVPLENGKKGASWQPVLLWGGLLSGLLIGSVLLRNWQAIWAPSDATAGSADTSGAVRQVPVSAGISGTVSSGAGTSLSPTVPNAQATPLDWSGNQSSVGNSKADGALNFTPMPPTQLSSEASANDSNRLSGNQPMSASVEGSVILQRARAMVLSNQATPYRDAILEAKKISQTDPVYGEAQQDIAGWSQTIWQIAQRRASQKRWDIAVMAAALVPSEYTELHSQAEAAITQWCPAVIDAQGTGFAAQRARQICND
jgi:hypothetical protein